MTGDADLSSEFVAADTSVLVRLTKASDESRAYEALRAGRRIALSFQAVAELRGYPEPARWGTRRTEALGVLLSACVELPHSPATSTWYSRVNQVRRESRNPCGDADVWIVAQTLEHQLPLMTHDRNQAKLAIDLGLEVLTALPSFQ